MTQGNHIQVRERRRDPHLFMHCRVGWLSAPMAPVRANRGLDG
jgi:hypothetical protein